MLKKRVLLTTLLSLAVILTAAGEVSTQQTQMLREEFHQTYPLSSQGRISLSNINGSVKVTAWDRDEVKVDAVKLAYRQDRLDEAKITVRADANTVHIQTAYPERTQNFTSGEGRQNNPAKVEYTLMVPRSARIDSIELINGNLNIEGITGDVKGSSINGRVSGQGLMGDVKLSTINGTVEAVFSRLNEAKTITLGSVNGPLTLIIPSDSNAEIKAGTVHGGITNDFGLPVRHGEYVGRDLAGQIGQGGARIKLGNVNGSITIKHASDGRPISRTTNLLGDKVKDKYGKGEGAGTSVGLSTVESRSIAREAVRDMARAQREARQSQIETQRKQRQAQLDIARAQAIAQRTQTAINRAQAAGQSSAQLEARRAQIDAQRTHQQTLLEAQRERLENARIAREAQRIKQVEAARIHRDAQRAVRDATRANRVEVDAGGSLRLVKRDTKTLKVSGTPQINLQTFDGYITVHGWDKQEVQLTFDKRAASEQQMNGINLRTEHHNSTVNVVATFDPSYERREGNVRSPNAVVNLDVYVPRNSMVRLHTGDGRLELDGVNGNLDLSTNDGRIDVRDARGRLTAKTGDGRIHVERFNGDLDVRTGDGRILLEGRFAQLAARTGSGSIMLTVPSDFNAFIETDAEGVDNQGLNLTEETSASRSLKRWKVGQGGRVFTLRTGEGRIFLRRAGQ
jgi:DUF4097 and DUF4098 domain-containing protein YvlB